MSESPEEPARAITEALEDARLAASDIQYVNLHGTSTEMNDRVETRALKLALCDSASKIPMSGLKSQIGHAQGACGAASLAATLVAMVAATLRRNGWKGAPRRYAPARPSWARVPDRGARQHTRFTAYTPRGRQSTILSRRPWREKACRGPIFHGVRDVPACPRRRRVASRNRWLIRSLSAH